MGYAMQGGRHKIPTGELGTLMQELSEKIEQLAFGSRTFGGIYVIGPEGYADPFSTFDPESGYAGRNFGASLERDHGDEVGPGEKIPIGLKSVNVIKIAAGEEMSTIVVEETDGLCFDPTPITDTIERYAKAA